MAPNEFLDKLLPAALACQKAAGIPASFTLAQAALESAWGTRVFGNNLFGVKADASWKGAIVNFATTEHLGGKRVGLTDQFRAYASWNDCIADRVSFFKKNPRYAACFRETTGFGWARAVAAAGFATDPDYEKKLVAVIRGRNLQRFDGSNAPA